MKKKLLIALLAVMATFCLAFGIAACSVNSGSNIGQNDGNDPGSTDDSAPEHVHALTHYTASEATCTESGNIEYWYCAECEEYFSDADATNEIEEENIAISALGHDLTTHAGQAATCTQSGWAEYVTCSRCDYTTYSESPIIGHTEATLIIENEVAATCTQEGSYDEVVYCTVCGEEISRNKVIVDATGHGYSEWEAVEKKTIKVNVKFAIILVMAHIISSTELAQCVVLLWITRQAFHILSPKTEPIIL